MRKNSLVVAVPLPQKEEAGAKTKEDTITTINNEKTRRFDGFFIAKLQIVAKIRQHARV